MVLRRATCGLTLLCAAVLLAGCTAAAETIDLSGTKLAGGAIEVTSTPVPPVAFDFCADKIAADKAIEAAKAAAIAAASRKARAARAYIARESSPVRETNATRRLPVKLVSCVNCGRTSQWTVRHPTRCPYCGKNPFWHDFGS
jgi:predicted Zn-ribbon and HTH transcriptional regulator